MSCIYQYIQQNDSLIVIWQYHYANLNDYSLTITGKPTQNG